jgi:hypothetical protein
MIVYTNAKVGIAGFLKSLAARKSCKAFFVSRPAMSRHLPTASNFSWPALAQLPQQLGDEA